MVGVLLRCKLTTMRLEIPFYLIKYYKKLYFNNFVLQMLGFEINRVVYTNCWMIKPTDWIVSSLMSKYMYLHNFNCPQTEMSKSALKEPSIFSQFIITVWQFRDSLRNSELMGMKELQTGLSSIWLKYRSIQ